MCLLTYIPPGTVPSFDYLADGCDMNQDGFGYAIVTADEGIIVGKGLKASTVLLDFFQTRREHMEGPALFHSRITTHGTTTVDNCHPFYVGADQRIVLAHNGVLPAVVQPRLGDLRSDTRIAAEWYIPNHLGNLAHKKARRRVERWMGPFNKMVVLSAHPDFLQSAYILNESAGFWEDDGCWYSNLSYAWGRSWRASKYVGGTTSKYEEDDDHPRISVSKDGVAKVEHRCNACGCYGWTDDSQYCPWCGSCVDCEALREDCQCWAPDDEDDEYRLPTTKSGSCPICGAYYACDCTPEDYEKWLAAVKVEEASKAALVPNGGKG